MSRVGLKPISIPTGVEVKVDGNVVRVKGPKGELTQEIPTGIKVVQDGAVVKVERPNDDGHYRAMHGLTRSLIANMVEGVTKGFEKVLEINGVGYRATLQGKKLVLSIGYSHPVEFQAQPGIEIEVPAPNRIIVKGADKQRVGQLAAEIRGVRPPEPYQGKGIKYVNETIRRKAGKAGKAGK